MNHNGLNKTSTPTGHKTRGVPPHIAWPLFVVCLLVLGVGIGMWVVVASLSDGGAQVVENYYQKAVEWDDRNVLVRQSDAVGWKVTLEYVAAVSADKPGGLEIQFQDAEGQPITGLKGIVRAYRPQATKALGELTITGVPGRPGVYTDAFPAASAGLWDFEIEVERDGFSFRKTIRKEL